MPGRHAVFGVEPPSSGLATSSTFRILVYGDSLTSGYPDYEPYAKGLVAACAAAGVGIKVVGCGLCGLTAADFVQHKADRGLVDLCNRTGIGFQKLLEDESLDEGPFALVLIMAGTNDIFAGRAPSEIVADLETLHRVCHERGAPTLALAIPEFASWKRSERERKAWSSANARLHDWALGVSEATFVDSGALLACTEETMGRGFWEPDGVHFTEAGSQAFGKALAPHVLAALGAYSAAAVVGAGAQPAATPGAEVGNGVEGQTAHRRLLILGGSLAQDESLSSGPSWASLLSSAARARGFEVRNDAIEGATVQVWQDRLCTPAASKLFDDCTVVFLSLCPSAESNSGCGSPEDSARDFAQALQMLLFIVKGLAPAEARIVLGGPFPTDMQSDAHLGAAQQLLAEMRSWEDADAVVDFLQPALHDGTGRWAPGLAEHGRPTAAGHQALFSCVALASVLAMP